MGGRREIVVSLYGRVLQTAAQHAVGGGCPAVEVEAHREGFLHHGIVSALMDMVSPLVADSILGGYRGTEGNSGAALIRFRSIRVGGPARERIAAAEAGIPPDVPYVSFIVRRISVRLYAVERGEGMLRHC